MNNWDLYDMVDGRNFNDLKQKLKLKYSTAPVEVVYWGKDSLGKPYVVVKRDRADKSERDPTLESVPTEQPKGKASVSR